MPSSPAIVSNPGRFDSIGQTVKKQLPNSQKYWAFISYSSKDRKWGEWLHKRLESYPIPKQFQGMELFDGAVLGKNLQPIFRDRDELAGSADLAPAILEALKQSRFLIVLCSRNSARSQWVNKEIEDFRKLGGEGKILALILDGEPNVTTEDQVNVAEECFPPALRYPAEPLAGDLRKEGDGKERGFLKVLAGISQLDFDGLYRRHERIQKKRRLILGGVATLLITILSGITIYAFEQRAAAKQQAQVAERETLEAERQRAAAEDARMEAVRAKETAEGLIYSMLFDLRDKLMPLGRVELLDDISLQTENYFKENPPENGESARNLATMWDNRGKVAMMERDVAAARKYYRKSHDLLTHLADIEPGNVEAQNDLSFSYQRLGEVAHAEGDWGKARSFYQDAMEIRRSLVEAEPANDKVLRGLGVSYENLGDVALAESDLDEAKGCYQKSAEIRKELAEADSSDVWLRRDVGVSYVKLGNVAQANKDLASAELYYSNALSIAKILMDAEPGNLIVRRMVSVSSDKLGDVIFAQGKVTEARKHYRNSLNICEELAEKDPRSVQAQRDVWTSYLRMAMLSESEKRPMAMQWWRKTHDKLLAMKKRGMLDPADEHYLDSTRQKLKGE